MSAGDLPGSKLVAQTLRILGVKHMFGIVGIPVIEIADACINEGIQFISFRNEQAAAYAASVYGYLTGNPGILLTVGGPGVIHSLAGVVNSNANRWPLVLIAGSLETSQRGMGGFQQLDQIALLKPMTKFAEQPASLLTVPNLIEDAFRISYFGRPGATYIDLPADIITSNIDAQEGSKLLHSIKNLGAAPRAPGDPTRVAAAAKLLRGARAPLLIVGKGCAYARAESNIRALQHQTKMAFLPTPMGKGVINDNNPFNVSAARSEALRDSDVILVVGARLNWMLHFGKPPRFNQYAKIIQVDSVAEELGKNGGDPEYGILGDVDLVTQQLMVELRGWQAPPLLPKIITRRSENQQKASQREHPTPGPLHYEPVYKAIREVLEEKVQGKILYVSEGANTMDISRSSFPLKEPRTRLDAGTNATMGVGLGYAIAAKLVEPAATVVLIAGDSAFGFSAMEVETAARNRLSLVIYVMNNSGIYHGVGEEHYKQSAPLPSTALSLNTDYHVLAESLGARGYLATNIEEVKLTTVAAIESNEVCVINVILDSGKDKPLKFAWNSNASQKL